MRTLGILMLAIPFIAFFVYIARTDGWKAATFIFGGTAILMAWVYAASYFLTES